MKTQISRHSFDPEKRYSGVYQQQGRMITDADWNELSEIFRARLDEALADAVGSGAPRRRGAGLVQTGQPVRIEAGRAYADGVGADLVSASDPGAETFDLDDQADFPAAPNPPAGGWVGYLDIWERPVIALESPEHLLDPALHGADTATRTQTMAQVKWAPGGLNPEKEEINPRRGDAGLSAELRSNIEIEDPCDPCAMEVSSEGRTGNFLFRLEVHDVIGDPTNPDGLTLKWSSENGAEQHDKGNHPPEFAASDWAYEFFDDVTEKHLGVHFATGFNPQREALVEGFPADLTGRRDRVRRWDGYCILKKLGGGWVFSDGRDRAVSLPQPGTPANPPHGLVEIGSDLVIHLERLRIELELTGKSFVAGDFWLAPVRENVAEGAGSLLTAAPPMGIVHHYLELGSVDGGGHLLDPSTERRRQLEFPPLSALEAGDVGYQTNCNSGLYGAAHDTVQKALDRLCEIDAEHVAYSPKQGCHALAGTSTVEQALDRLCGNAALQYVAGDGQEGVPGEPLPALLEARTAVGRFAEPGRSVRFQIVQGSGGKLEDPTTGASDTAVTVKSDGAGLAGVSWHLDPNDFAQRVEAVMVDSANNAIGGALAYNATHETAGGADPRVRVEGLKLGGNEFKNEMTVPVSTLNAGLSVVCSDAVDPLCFEQRALDIPSPARPNLEVALYMPFPLDEGWGFLASPAGFQPLILQGEVSASGKTIQWTPGKSAGGWLVNNLFQRVSEVKQADRLLVHIRLRGNFVWRETRGRPTYLDGEAYGVVESGRRVGIDLPSGNGTSGGDLEAWFWIEADEEPPPFLLDVNVSGSTITGKLSDSSGAPIPGVAVNLQGATSRTTMTNMGGSFTFPSIPTGTYTVSVNIAGQVVSAQVSVGRINRPIRDVLNPGVVAFDPGTVNDRSVRAVPGIGPATGTTLQRIGITLASQLAMADPRRLAGQAGVPLSKAEQWVRNARKLLLTP